MRLLTILEGLILFAILNSAPLATKARKNKEMRVKAK
jgi:hypothetical protein